MQNWPEINGSPFSLGFCKNISQILCTNPCNDIPVEHNFPGNLPKEITKKAGFIKCRILWKKLCD